MITFFIFVGAGVEMHFSFVCKTFRETRSTVIKIII